MFFYILKIYFVLGVVHVFKLSFRPELLDFFLPFTESKMLM